MKLRLTALAVALSLSALAGAALAQAPVAAPAGPPPLPSGVPEFEVAKYDPFSWYGRFGYTNCAFVDMGDGVLVIDTGWTAKDAENLKAQIAEKTKGKPVRWIVLTHLHADSNGGLTAFLPTDATIFVHAAAADLVARNTRLTAKAGDKVPTVIGIGDELAVAAGARRFSLLAAAPGAHSSYDLVALLHDNGLAFVGDLVTGGRCPLLTDAAADPVRLISVIDRIKKMNPAGLVTSRGEPTRAVENELDAARKYLERVVSFLKEQKAKGSPEAQVSAMLSLRKLGDYCPQRLDTVNVLDLYRKMRPDGTFGEPGSSAPSGGAPKPQAATPPKK